MNSQLPHRQLLVPSNKLRRDIFNRKSLAVAGYNSVPSRYSERVALLMLFIVPAVLLPAHSGGLISSLTVPLDTIPFRDLEGFVKDGTYRLGAINNSYMHMFLLVSFKSVIRGSDLPQVHFCWF